MVFFHLFCIINNLFDIIIEFGTHIANLSEGSGILHIPSISDPFYNIELIKEQDLNFKEIFNTGAIGTIYNIYLSFVDVIIVIGLASLCKKKYDEIVGGNS